MPVSSPSFLERLPVVRGHLVPQAPLKDTTWFHVGGPAEILYRPADEADLAQFLKELPADIPVTILGLASNVIVRDGGIPGVVIRLGPEFRTIKADGDIIYVGAAAVDQQVARTALARSLTGLEFMSGIPGSVGGGLRMNAGAYGREFKDVVIDARAVDRQGNIHTLTNAEMGFSYRHSAVPEDWVFVSARLQGTKGDADAIAAKMQDIQNARGSTQPIRSYTGGSTFANPENGKAWQLIDDAGCRGMRLGGAEVSTQHCNFLINTGGASATDLESLGESVRAKVARQSGINLRWEIRRYGLLPQEMEG
jgi:UDP-N-acetylmuramate dehydrogenase